MPDRMSVETEQRVRTKRLTVEEIQAFLSQPIEWSRDDPSTKEALLWSSLKIIRQLLEERSEDSKIVDWIEQHADEIEFLREGPLKVWLRFGGQGIATETLRETVSTAIKAQDAARKGEEL